MFAPLAILGSAVALGFVLAYGTAAPIGSWGAHGIDVILWVRRLQWPLAGTAVLLSLWMIGLVVSGRRRAWWMFGLLPVVALFLHRFVVGSNAHGLVADDPPFTSADRASTVAPDELVVGVMWNGTPYAFPYAKLFHTPVIVQTDRTGPLVVVWSAYANRAFVFTADRDVRPRDLEIVSDPMNAQLLYNGRFGEFVNGVTGLTPAGRLPKGFVKSVPVVKTLFGKWRELHPQSRVLAPTEATLTPGPTGPLEPQFKVPGDGDHRSVCVLSTPRPVAVGTDAITDQPLNLNTAGASVVVVRSGPVVHAFDRSPAGGAAFRSVADPKHKAAVWIDDKFNALWSATGEVVDGPAATKGLKLTPIFCEDGLYLDVERYWLPDLHVASVDEVQTSATTRPAPNPKKKPR